MYALDSESQSNLGILDVGHAETPPPPPQLIYTLQNPLRRAEFILELSAEWLFCPGTYATYGSTVALKALSLVSRQLASVALPLIFHRLNVVESGLLLEHPIAQRLLSGPWPYRKYVQ